MNLIVEYQKNVTMVLGSSQFYNNENGSPDASFPAFDIPTMIENMKHEKTWRDGELGSIILLKSPAKKVMLTLLHEGTEVSSVQKNDSVTFQVIEGKLKLHFGDESHLLQTGELITLNEKIRYSINSIEETAFLLTLVSGNP